MPPAGPSMERNAMSQEQMNGYQLGNPNAAGAPPQAPAPAPQGTSAMAITGLVIGIVALGTSFLPIINNVSFFIGLVGLVLAIVGIAGTGKRKKKGRGMAVAGLVISIASIAVVLGSQAFYSSVIDSALDSAKATPRTAAEQSAAGDSSPAAAAGDSAAAADAAFGLSIDSVQKGTDYSGGPVAIATYTFTNNSTEATSFIVSISAKAFQNGVQLDTAIGSGWDSSGSMKELKPGSSTTVQMGYKLDDNSPLTIEASELWDFSDEVLLEETFSFE